jgi:Universal stress protein family
MTRVRRVIAGVSGSARGLPALRYAADLAHAHGGTLVPVHAWAPSALELAGGQTGWPDASRAETPAG